MSVESQADFLAGIEAAINELKIDLGDIIEDHVCYRVESLERYEQLKSYLQDRAIKHIESPVNGRLISLFHLSAPINSKKLSFSFYELPAPKQGSSYVEGYEHAEFVVASLKSFQKKYRHIDFDHTLMNSDKNQVLQIKLSNNTFIKLHERMIFEVALEEQKV